MIPSNKEKDVEHATQILVKISMKIFFKSPIHFDNLNKRNTKWRRSETCNVEKRSTVCDKPVKSNKHWIQQGHLVGTDMRNLVPGLREILFQMLITKTYQFRVKTHWSILLLLLTMVTLLYYILWRLIHTLWILLVKQLNQNLQWNDFLNG